MCRFYLDMPKTQKLISNVSSGEGFRPGGVADHSPGYQPWGDMILAMNRQAPGHNPEGVT